MRILVIVALLLILGTASLGETYFHDFNVFDDGCPIGVIITDRGAVFPCDYQYFPDSTYLRCTFSYDGEEEYGEANFILFKIKGAKAGDVIRVRANVRTYSAVGGYCSMIGGFWHDGVSVFGAYDSIAFRQDSACWASFEETEVYYEVVNPSDELLVTAGIRVHYNDSASVVIDWMELEFPEHIFLETPNGVVGSQDKTWGGVKAIFR